MQDQETISTEEVAARVFQGPVMWTNRITGEWRDHLTGEKALELSRRGA